MEKRFTYPKSEKLKSRNTINLLFSEGLSVAKYPLRLVYVRVPDAPAKLQAGVSVSKKYFKKAADRNYFKRLLREAYRLNKHLLTDAGNAYAVMLLYQTNDRLGFEEINSRTIRLFEKFMEQENANRH
ncbi:ribonuclease P protein component [Flavobacterium cyanobacteriorum]|uniref:Ribonuclease P protein component n=1 Tax=Flavobacterium cyanobacteriorum TaxID=2022802 RepID=A0A255YYZ3_9FLAO|nr:ribonuclease P protein component [Flavobacterium cyanobacteriorum]OYQ34418.1 ribonuclease P protein component [Flavobacterium cyanobacteriorum]